MGRCYGEGRCRRAPPDQESGFLQDVESGGPQGPMSDLLSTIAVPNRNQEPEPHDNEQRQYYGNRRVGGDVEAQSYFALERITMLVRDLNLGARRDQGVDEIHAPIGSIAILIP